jgi:hypothetical protein
MKSCRLQTIFYCVLLFFFLLLVQILYLLILVFPITHLNKILF